MKNYILYIILFTAGVLQGCNKETATEDLAFMNVYVSYANFIEAPDVTISINGVVADSMQAGSDYKKVLPMNDEPVTLSFKRISDGAVLLDTTFVPQRNNRFTIFVSDLLGIHEFSKPVAGDVDADHIRMQLYHKVIVNGVEHRRVDFRFFTRAATSGPFTETPYELKNVEFGRLSEPIDLPTPVNDELYYVKIYDAETHDLLLDLWEDYADGRIFYNTGGRSIIVNVQTDDYPPDGAFFNILAVYEL